MSQIVLAAAGGSPQQDPVGGAITGSAKAFRIDEGLDEPDRVLIHSLPIARQRCSNAAEYVRGQVRHLDPRQDQKARVVGDQSDVTLAGFLAPTDVAIAAAQMARR